MYILKKHLIVGLCGRAGVGKDTTAEAIYRAFYIDCGIPMAREPIYIQASGGIKSMLCNLYNISEKQLNESKKNPLGRWILEQVGTNYLGRVEILDYIKSRLDSIKVPSLVLIPGVRHQDEADLILERDGFIIRIWRPQVETNVEVRPSEKEILHVRADFAIHNDNTLGLLEFMAKDTAKLITLHPRFNKIVCTSQQ